MSDFNPSIFDNLKTIKKELHLGWEAESFIEWLREALDKGKIDGRYVHGASMLLTHIQSFKDAYRKKHEDVVRFQAENAELLKCIEELREDIARAAAVYLGIVG